MDSLGIWEASLEEEQLGDVPRELDRVKYNYCNSKKHYAKLGSAGIKGSLYQIELLTMVLLNGLRKVESWRLSTEDKEAAQLDDLIFEHLPSECTVLLQAKHKEDERKEVTYKDLMSVNKNSDFSLPKYFFSYQEVKNKFKVQTIVICTNLKLDEKTRSVLKEESVDPDSVLHFEEAENIYYSFSGCSLPELEQNIKTYQARYVKNKEVSVSVEDISDFLKHLIFVPNCLGDKDVENIAQQTISRMRISENLNSKMIHTYIHKKMTDWFKEKKGRYLTEVEAKAFFCDMRSNKYCEELKLYDISFKNQNLPVIFQTQPRREENGENIDNDAPMKVPKRISHIIPDKEYVLNAVKVYQALPTHHRDKTLFVNPEETVEAQKEIIEAFAVQHYTVLVMVRPNRIEEMGETCERVMKILGTYKYKHVILIAEERNSLATQLKDANISYYEAITDNVTFADLEGTTKEEFKRKRLINFQGRYMSLEELFTPPHEDDLNQIVNSEMLIKLARGRESEIGLEPPRLDNYYVSRSFNRNGQNIPEEDLWRSTEVSKGKVILISDSAGMGKSSVLTSLTISIRRDNPHLWVVRFDLNNYTRIMETMKEGRTNAGIVEMLNSQEKSRLKSEFGKKLFATPKRVVLMLDGVDEVSPTYTELVINLIRDSVAQVNVARIFVTARPHMSKDLGRISELQSFTFEPFSRVNQKNFLMKYWTETLDLRDDARKTKCNIYAEALVENISVWINEKDRNNFAGIPLQTRMLAEIFQDENQIHDDEHDWEGCKEFSLSDNEQPKFPRIFDIIQLYKLFIDKKCDIFIRKSNPSRSVVADEALKHQLEKCQKYHRALALKVIFDSDRKLQLFTCYANVERPIPTTFANDYLFAVGIIQRQESNIEFLHRTFAEYFTAECLLVELERKPVNKEFQEFFMSSIMVDLEFYVTRAFLNSRMPSVLRSMENNFRSYFRRNRIYKWPLANYLKVLAAGGCARILDCFIKCIDKEQRKVLSETVNNLYLMDDAINFAIRYGHLNILKLLLDLNETFNMGKDSHKEFLRKAATYAVDYNLETFKFLLRQVDKNILGRTALHEAAFMGRLDAMKSLMTEAEADVNIKDNKGLTALHTAAFSGRLEVGKISMEEAGADMSIKDSHGRTALHEAAFWGVLKIVKFLVQIAGADVNTKNHYGETALHMAAHEGELETVKFLVDAAGADASLKNDNGWTALHAAAYSGRLEIVKFLMEKAKPDINIKDNNGSTALHVAAHQGEVDVVKFLVHKAGADLTIENNRGMTALHVAADRGRWKVVKFLSNSSRWVMLEMKVAHFFRGRTWQNEPRIMK